MIKSIYKKGWHVQQWVSVSFVQPFNEVTSATEHESEKPKQESSGDDAPSKDATSPTTTSKLPPPKHLFDLPGEIINMIWRLAALEPNPPALKRAGQLPMIIANTYHPFVHAERVPGRRRRDGVSLETSPPAFFSTCRQFHTEIAPIYFAENTFTLVLDSQHSFEAAQSWTEHLGEKPLAWMPGLVLQGPVVKNRNTNDAVCWMRIWIDFRSLRVRHEAVEGVDQSQELAVVERTLRDMREADADARDLSTATMTTERLDLIIANFGRCCAVLRGRGAVPLLAKDGEHNPLATAEEQEEWIESFLLDD